MPVASHDNPHMVSLKNQTHFLINEIAMNMLAFQLAVVYYFG